LYQDRPDQRKSNRREPSCGQHRYRYRVGEGSAGGGYHERHTKDCTELGRGEPVGAAAAEKSESRGIFGVVAELVVAVVVAAAGETVVAETAGTVAADVAVAGVAKVVGWKVGEGW
jgi:hypothetical protein